MAADLNHGIKRDGFIIHGDRPPRAATSQEQNMDEVEPKRAPSLTQ